MIIENIPYHPGKWEISNNTSLRIKVTNKCQFRCYFCHHEGCNTSQDLELTEALKSVLLRFHDELHYSQIHLTGGEPTLYSDCLNLIEYSKSIGFVVKMTSNGQFPSEFLTNMAEAGLDSINFSIHTLNPVKLAKIQKPRRSILWGIDALGSQLRNIIKANEVGLNTKVNAVVQNDASILDIISFCWDEKIELRILDDLNPDSLSMKRIIEVLKGLGAHVVNIRITSGSSSYSYDVITKDGFEFKVKAIRKFALKSMCDSCPVRDVCQEWFYGIRVEQKREKLMIRLCIQRQDEPAIQEINQFLESKQYDEIKQLSAIGQS